MSETTEATTTVEVEVRGREATIADLQDALDTLRREGIPDTFAVSVWQREDRVYEKGVEHADQRKEHRLTVKAERTAVSR